MRVLLVEDDDQLGESLAAALRLEGYAVDWLQCGAGASASLSATPYDLLILDIGLPDISGLRVLRQLRSDHHVLPVLMLTARSAVADRVDGLDAGADDFLAKPFELDELFARLRSLLRRRDGYRKPLLEAAGVALDPVSRDARCDGLPVGLTARELGILEILLRNAGRYVSRAQLEEGIYSWGEEVGSNTVEVYISRLRKQLGSTRIQTQRGVGYRIPDD